jgi:Rps23 Pro-64 3,4-dihydroxylase Tpa1-like proline 4-hydroxylase
MNSNKVINKRTLAPGIVVYSNVLENHKELLQKIENGVSKNLEKWDLALSVVDGVQLQDKKIRDTDAMYIEYRDHIITESIHEYYEFRAELSNAFLSGFKDLEADYKSEYNLSTSWHDCYGILKYGAGQNVVDHIDDSQTHHRRMSTVYYFNDDYTGGEVIFPRFDITYKPVANELLVFPSTYVYNHSVVPVVEGTRYAVVSWLR